jgi:AcrR family transcriptional regulator
MRGVDRRLPRVGHNGLSEHPIKSSSEVPRVVTHTTPSPVGPLRRVPVQGRSLARVHRMLDACAELVDEVGYDGLTTTLLAERAAVAIGSVYQFFPDKRAIVQALAMRNVEAYVTRVTARVASGTLPNWWDAVDAAMDEFIDMHRGTPGFRTLRFGDVVDRFLLDEERDNDTVIAEQLGQLLVQEFGLPDGANLRLAMTVAVEIADALVKLAFRRDPEGDRPVLAQAKEVVRDYLYRQLNPPPERVVVTGAGGARPVGFAGAPNPTDAAYPGDIPG